MSASDPPRFSERVYRALLLAYPKDFRDAYGAHMAQVFGDVSREARRRGEIRGLLGFWMRTFLDLALTAFVERSRAMRWKFLVPLAFILGLLIAFVDSSPGWDDTGVTAATVFVCCGLLGALHPARPWLWALAVGVWIPALGIIQDWNYASLLALAFALSGAYAGALASRSLGAA